MKKTTIVAAFAMLILFGIGILADNVADTTENNGKNIPPLDTKNAKIIKVSSIKNDDQLQISVMPNEITVVGTFTAQTNEEARYLVAVLTFLRASTMIDFGNAAVQRDTAGTPPPVLRWNYLGQRMFKNVPVVVTTFNYMLDRDVDYIEVTFPGTSAGLRETGLTTSTGPSTGQRPVKEDVRTYVPTQMVLTVTMGVQQNPRNTRDNFDLEALKRGDLINKGFI